MRVPTPRLEQTYHGNAKKPNADTHHCTFLYRWDRDCNLGATAASQLSSEGEQLMSAAWKPIQDQSWRECTSPAHGRLRTLARSGHKHGIVTNRCTRLLATLHLERAKAWRGGVDGLRPLRYRVSEPSQLSRRMLPLPLAGSVTPSPAQRCPLAPMTPFTVPPPCTTFATNSHGTCKSL